MTMSWVAPEKPTITANRATLHRLVAGSVPEISQRPSMIISWVTTIQERRWPSHLVRIGTVVRSIHGAQTNFRE
jgi:hypothetical protein